MEIKDLLRECGFRFEKKFGQNFLTDGNLLSAIVSDAGVTAEDTVVEIGAGAGTLTAKLAGAAGRVIAFEIDENLRKPLAAVLGRFGNVETVFGDVMDFSMEEIESMAGGPYKVVANLPYYITTPVIMKFIEQSRRMTSMTVMVQKEAAQRLCAAPGTREAGAISYAVAYYAQPKLLFTVQPGSFYPAPSVTSAVIRLDVRPQPPVQLPPEQEKAFFALIRAAFSQRRKTAANAIANGLSLPKAKVLAALEAAGLDQRARPEQLTLEQYAALQRALQSIDNRT